MQVKKHIMFSFPAGALVYAATGDPLAGALCSIASVVIDADHALDYTLVKKQLSSYSEMTDAFHRHNEITKMWLIFHSWELMITFGVWLFFNPDIYGFAILSGLVLHLACDQFYNTRFAGSLSLKPMVYFFLFRLYCRFATLNLRQTVNDPA